MEREKEETTDLNSLKGRIRGFEEENKNLK